MALKDTLRIMVVGDMSVSRGLLVQSLEEMGLWKNETENSAQSAPAKLTANPAHLVHSHHNMPGMDGLGCFRPCAPTA
jgi:two-component system chemotaxis response regulator CheY